MAEASETETIETLLADFQLAACAWDGSTQPHEKLSANFKAKRAALLAAFRAAAETAAMERDAEYRQALGAGAGAGEWSPQFNAAFVKEVEQVAAETARAECLKYIRCGGQGSQHYFQHLPECNWWMASQRCNCGFDRALRGPQGKGEG